MKKFILEYISIIGYVITGLVFSLAVFLLFINFYHYKEVNEKYVKGGNYLEIYNQVNENISKVKQNISVYDNNKYNGPYNKTTLVQIQSKLSLCASSFEGFNGNEILKKKEVTVKDTYKLLANFQSDIINDCIVMQLYNLKAEEVPSYNSMKYLMDIDNKMLIEQSDYIKKTLQGNTSYFFSSEYDKINVFNMNRDSYTAMESTYKKSSELLLEISNWYKTVVEGGV